MIKHCLVLAFLAIGCMAPPVAECCGGTWNPDCYHKQNNKLNFNIACQDGGEGGPCGQYCYQEATSDKCEQCCRAKIVEWNCPISAKCCDEEDWNEKCYFEDDKSTNFHACTSFMDSPCQDQCMMEKIDGELKKSKGAVKSKECAKCCREKEKQSEFPWKCDLQTSDYVCPIKANFRELEDAFFDPTFATCCDKDGDCSDGSDAYCCGNEFYCTNNGKHYAEKMGGVLCPVQCPEHDVNPGYMHTLEKRADDASDEHHDNIRGKLKRRNLEEYSCGELVRDIFKDANDNKDLENEVSVNEVCNLSLGHVHGITWEEGELPQGGFVALEFDGSDQLVKDICPHTCHSCPRMCTEDYGNQFLEDYMDAWHAEPIEMHGCKNWIEKFSTTNKGKNFDRTRICEMSAYEAFKEDENPVLFTTFDGMNKKMKEICPHSCANCPADEVYVRFDFNYAKCCGTPTKLDLFLHVCSNTFDFATCEHVEPGLQVVVKFVGDEQLIQKVVKEGKIPAMRVHDFELETRGAILVGEKECVCPSSWIGDGDCDPHCDNLSCQFDGGDCEHDTHGHDHGHHHHSEEFGMFFGPGGLLFFGGFLASFLFYFCW